MFSAEAALIEVVGATGFDFVMLDSEYSAVEYGGERCRLLDQGAKIDGRFRSPADECCLP